MRLAFAVAVAVAVVVAGLAACASEERGELPTPSDWPGAVTWSWSFEGGGPCPPGVTRANVFIASYDVDRNFPLRIEPRVMTTAKCADGAASFALSNPRGVRNAGHDTWLELATADGRIYARSPIANTKTEDASPTAVIATARGWFHVRWTLRGGTTGAPLTCADVPDLSTASFADGAIELYTSVDNDIVLQPSLVDCAAGELWVAVPAGTYDLTLGAFSSFIFYLGAIDNPRLLGKTALGTHTVADGETIDLGTRELVLPGY